MTPADSSALVRRVPILATAPQHTARLLFASEADPDTHVDGIQINILISSDLNVSTSRAERNDPSTIYLNAPVREGRSTLVEPLPYFPTYNGMTPQQRGIYLHWLCDITQPVDIGYVFVYYYGLERHLAHGDFDAAVDEILILRRHHRNGSFMGYSASALMHGCLIRKRVDVLRMLYRLPDYNFFDNSNLLILHYSGTDMAPDILIQLAERISGVNRRYLKADRRNYLATIQTLLEDRFGRPFYPLATHFPLAKVEKAGYPLFANTSLPSEIRSPSLPNLLHHPPFQDEMRSFFRDVHETIKADAKQSRGRGMPPANQKALKSSEN